MEHAPTQQGLRPPVVAIVGHIDHGKSTLLDYIRRTNVTEDEAGGITQHLSAYQAQHVSGGVKRLITFLDTPGHEAFRAMRSRGLEAADVGVLVVSAEDGVKTQTVEALTLLKEAGIPYIVAFTKIDKPAADLEKSKYSLLEHEIYLEGMGGDVPWVAVSSKTGEGIPELLDLVLLAGELEGLSSNNDLPGEGLVIESRIDPRRGSGATLIVENGTVRSGEYVVAGSAFAPVRIMENFLGKPIKEALPGSPVRIIGFSSVPTVGVRFHTVESKQEAEADVAASKAEEKPVEAPAPRELDEDGEEKEKLILPVIIKTDTAGTGEAVLHEIKKIAAKHEGLAPDTFEVRIIARTVGAITESDVRLAGAGKTPGVVLGFNVKLERDAREAAERLGVSVQCFDIIYKLAEWLDIEVDKRRPREDVDETTSSARILKVFSSQKGRLVLGGRVTTGELSIGNKVKFIRRDEEVGRGEILSLQTQKVEVKSVESGQEFGAQIKTNAVPVANDELAAFTVVQK